MTELEKMFGFLLVAQALGVINQYFSNEAAEADFWDPPVEYYNSLGEEEYLVYNQPTKIKQTI